MLSPCLIDLSPWLDPVTAALKVVPGSLDLLSLFQTRIQKVLSVTQLVPA